VRLIAHKGLWQGSDNNTANTTKQLKMALKAGYDVECDIIERDGKLWLGHDEPKEEIDIEFLKDSRIFAHAKDERAYKILIKENIQSFMQNNEILSEIENSNLWWVNSNYKVPYGKSFKNCIIHYSNKDLICNGVEIFGIYGDYVGV